MLSIDRQDLPKLFAKKHALPMCFLLIYVDKYGLREASQEAMYDAWQKNKPSRTTFVSLLKEFEEIGFITRQPGRKKSSVKIKVNSHMLAHYVGLKPLEEFIPSNCWVFDSGTFDANAFLAHDDFQELQP